MAPVSETSIIGVPALCPYTSVMQKFDLTTIVRTIDVLKPLEWLALGWKDISRLRWLSLVHGIALTLAGG